MVRCLWLEVFLVVNSCHLSKPLKTALPSGQVTIAQVRKMSPATPKIVVASKIRILEGICYILVGPFMIIMLVIVTDVYIAFSHQCWKIFITFIFQGRSENHLAMSCLWTMSTSVGAC